jgi:hypothetical protein
MTTIAPAPKTAIAPASTTVDGPVRAGGRRMTPMLGPAFVAAIAYVDPGNVATNLTAGATFGYLLVWVVVAASLVAVLVQFQAAKLGLATGQSLPELCRRRFPRWGSRLLWLQAEVVVLATDLAEFVGAAIGLRLLFGVPIAVSAVATAVVSLLLLELRRRGRTRPFELMSAAALLLVGRRAIRVAQGDQGEARRARHPRRRRGGIRRSPLGGAGRLAGLPGHTRRGRHPGRTDCGTRVVVHPARPFPPDRTTRRGRRSGSLAHACQVQARPTQPPGLDRPSSGTARREGGTP